MERKNYARAIEAFETLRKLGKEDKESLINLGVAYKASRPMETGGTVLPKSIGYDRPGTCYQLRITTWVYLYFENLKDLDKAEESFRAYLQSSSTDGQQVFAWIKQIRQQRRTGELQAKQAKQEEIREQQQLAAEKKQQGSYSQKRTTSSRGW